MMADEIGIFSFNDAQRIYDATISGQCEFKEHSRPTGGGGLRFYLYTLTGSSVATIRNMPDTDEIETGATVIDTIAMFADQTTGDRGVCFKQDKVYYRIQAPCKT